MFAFNLCAVGSDCTDGKNDALDANGSDSVNSSDNTDSTDGAVGASKAILGKPFL